MRVAAAVFFLALAGSSASAQGPSTSTPDAAAPGPATEIIGPNGSFRLKPDGVQWERFQTNRAIGVKCTDKACGGERVFCMIQVRSSPDARPGLEVSEESAAKFGEGVLKSAPKEMKAEMVEPFVGRTIGANPGRWAVAKAEGEPGSIRFGLFLVEAEQHEIAMNCVSPGASWEQRRPQIEALIASLQITR